MDHLWTPWRYSYLVDDDPLGRKGVPEALAAWPGDCDCVFCNLIGATRYAVEQGGSPTDADREANIVLRGEFSFVVLNAFPYSSGHVMIVPYAHQATLAGRMLDNVVALEMMTLAQRTDAVLRQVYTPDGVNMGLNLGKAAGAGVGRAFAHACPAAVVGGLQLYDRDRGDQGASGDASTDLGAAYGRVQPEGRVDTQAGVSSRSASPSSRVSCCANSTSPCGICLVGLTPSAFNISAWRITLPLPVCNFAIASV